MRKFDLVVGNPPYNNGMDIDIHKAFSGISRKIVFVHPSTFLVSHKRNSFNKVMKKIDVSKFESAHLFWGNALFNIQLYVPVVVSRWNADKTDKKVAVVDDAYTNCTYVADYDKVHHYGKDYPRLLKWLEENIMPICQKNGSVHDHGEWETTTEFGFRMSTMRGHPPLTDFGGLKDDFFTILPQTDKVIESNFCGRGVRDESYRRMYSFASEAERRNFIGYLKTKTARFCLSVLKFSNMLMRGELTGIPWMDFSREWTDEDLRAEFGIDEEMWRFIDGKIPDYY